jgi:hypothetical protein
LALPFLDCPVLVSVQFRACDPLPRACDIQGLVRWAELVASRARASVGTDNRLR